MSELRHPGKPAALAIHREVLAAHGGGDGIRSGDLLESAIAAPQATMGAQALMSDPCEIAAAYLYYLSSNHPFVDGNKRVALATCLVFLESNGLLPEPILDVEPWLEFTMNVASGSLSREETREQLKNLLQVG